MSGSNLTLDGAVVGTVNLVVSLSNNNHQVTKYLVDEEDTLAHVELSILNGIDSFNLNEVLIGILKNLRSTINELGITQTPTFCNP